MKNSTVIHTCLTPADGLFEQGKNNLLADVYENNCKAAQQIYIQIVEQAENLPYLSENTQKQLRQIQVVFKRFKHILSLCLITQDHYRRLERLLFDTLKKSSSPVRHVDFSNWNVRLGLTRNHLELIAKTAMTFQLTSGCSNYCRRCNEWALPKIRSHFSFDAVKKILGLMSEQRNDEISLFGASDPLDWEEDTKNISHIIDYIDSLPLQYSLLTKVPRGKESLLEQLMNSHSNLSVSITGRNKKRIRGIEQKIDIAVSKQHDLEELLIPAGLDEDFVSVKPSITDGYGTEITPDGAFIIIPTFTSALHPFGHKKIRITEKTNFFPIKKTGRNALLVDYFKPLEGWDLNHEKHYLKRLLDVQIESIILDNGTDPLTPPGMRSLKEYLFIFEEDARNKREKITPSVFKRLKKQFLADTAFRRISPEIRSIYLKQVTAHTCLCKKENCTLAKLYALSFFLDAIHQYQLKNPTKIRMMLFLLKDEMHCIFDAIKNTIGNTPIETVFDTPDLDSFDCFRYFVFCLLTRTETNRILSFINAHPSGYDPLADMFIRSSNK